MNLGSPMAAPAYHHYALTPGHLDPGFFHQTRERVRAMAPDTGGVHQGERQGQAALRSEVQNCRAANSRVLSAAIRELREDLLWPCCGAAAAGADKSEKYELAGRAARCLLRTTNWALSDESV